MATRGRPSRGNRTQFVIRVPTELGDRVIANAEDLGASRTDYLTQLIAFSIEHMPSPAAERPQQSSAFELRDTG